MMTYVLQPGCKDGATLKYQNYYVAVSDEKSELLV